jgi:peptidyl-prolyl cis-trans isomerase D
MLQKIRSNIQGMMAKIIIGIICVPFVLWGIDALFVDHGNADVAEVNGKPITEWELNQQIYRQRQQILAQMGENIDPSQIDESLLREPVLQRLIEQRLLESTAESQKFVVSERMVDEAIVQDPSFQVDGKFSPERFDAMVRGSGMSPMDYKRAMKNQLLVNQLLSGLGFSEFVTPAEVAMAAQITGQKRDIEYAVFSLSDAREGISIDEAAVQKYFDEHAKEFMTRERVVAEYIELTLEDFFPEVDEAEIKAAYAAEIAKVEASTKRRAAHILLETGDKRSAEEARAQLEALRQRIAAGEDFAALAGEYSEDLGSKAAGGDLGYSSGDAFPEAFEAALATLQPGEVSAPVATEAGWHLIQLTEQESSTPATYEARRDAIARQWQQSKAEPQYAVKLEALKDLSFNAPDLQSVAQELGLALHESPPFDRDGADAGPFADQRLVAEAFTKGVLEEGVNSEVIEIAPDHSVVLRLKRRIAPEPIPFDEVSGTIREKLQQDQARRLMTERARQLRDALRQGEAFAAIADAQQLTYKKYTGLSRDSIEDANPEIVGAAFRLSPPLDDKPVVAIRNLQNGDTALVVVDKVVPGSVDEIEDEKRANMQRLLSRYRSEQVLEGFRATLHQGADIELP